MTAVTVCVEDALYSVRGRYRKRTWFNQPDLPYVYRSVATSMDPSE